MMAPFADLILALAGLLPGSTGSANAGIQLTVVQLDVTLPLESRIEPGAELHASLPRGRLSTGFDPPLEMITARFEVRSA